MSRGEVFPRERDLVMKVVPPSQDEASLLAALFELITASKRVAVSPVTSESGPKRDNGMAKFSEAVECSSPHARNLQISLGLIGTMASEIPTYSIAAQFAYREMMPTGGQRKLAVASYYIKRVGDQLGTWHDYRQVNLSPVLADEAVGSASDSRKMAPADFLSLVTSLDTVRQSLLDAQY